MSERVVRAADINVIPLIDVMLVLLIIFGLAGEPLGTPTTLEARLRGAGAERIGLIRREPEDR